MNPGPTLTSAGIWVPVTNVSYLSQSYNGTLANTFHAIIQIGPAGQYGMVVTGWGYSGWPATLATAAPVSVALLTPDSNANLSINTSAYIADPVTSGGGSAIVADFNGDGKPDIFLAAHNESPFIAMPSTAYLSNGSDTFTKVTLTDHVMAHDAELAYINGKPVVLTGTFSPGDSNPIYSFANGTFVESIAANVSQLWGMDTTLVDSGPAAGLQLIRGDVNSDYNPSTGYSARQDIVVYAFDGHDVSGSLPLQVITPYLSTLPQYKTFPAQIGGPGLTHTYRVWADDLNHDGKQDILAGESMWSQANNEFPSALQVLINRGDGTFKDATASLNPEMSLNVSEMDYNPTFIDIDHSGINTYLFAGSTSWGSMARQADYVLLNDGTGRLYIGLHEQFKALALQVFSYLGMSYNAFSTPPRFIGIPQADGSLNFVAEISTGTFNSAANISQTAYQYVNVPLHYSPTTDFRTDITISDRNGSMLMRTWAGNDTVYDTNPSTSPTSIDGGLGTDAVVYSGVQANYTITSIADGFKIDSNAGIHDTLKNIEYARFADKAVLLSSLDTTAPTVISVSPAPKASAVAVSTDIVFAFSEAIQRGVGTILLKTAGGTLVASYEAATSTNLSIFGSTLSIKPSADLGIFAGYKVELPAGAIKDLVGNKHAGVSDYNFTTQTLDSLYQFCVVAFSAAPGVEYMNQLAVAYNAGLTVKQIVNIFTTKPQFTSTYADSMTNTDFATLLVANVVKDSASAAIKAQAVNDIVDALRVWSRGDTIYQIFGNLASKPLSDPDWGNTAHQFDNQTEVARYFTEVMHNSATDMPTLKAALGAVTPTTDVSTPQVIAALIGVELSHLV